MEELKSTQYSFTTREEKHKTMFRRNPKMLIRRVPSPFTTESPSINSFCNPQKNNSVGKNDEAPLVVEGDAENGRERLKRHRTEMAGQVRIPDKWSQEEMLRDWLDYSTFDALLAPKGLASAREALVAERRRARGLRIEGMC